MKKLNVISIVLFLTMNSLNVFAQKDSTKSEFKNSGFIDFNGYYDTREYGEMTINALGNLKNGFQYFSLTNYTSADASADFSGYYSEQNLRWTPSSKKPFALTAQWVIKGNQNNDNLRLGAIWKVSKTNLFASAFKKINLFYFVNFHLLQFQNKVDVVGFSQIEHVYKFRLLPKTLNNRLYLGGFADQTFVYQDNGNVSFQWVSEHQLGFRVIDQFYLVSEFRINDYRASDNYGLGYGVEYKLIF